MPSNLSKAARLIGWRVLPAILLVLPGMAMAAGGGGAFMRHAEIDPGNTASLQRGAKYFVNYCQGCHSAKYVRYKRIGEALDLSEQQLQDNLMFSAEKVHETMVSAMPGEDAARWFGAAPPDLSLVARSRGADWLFSYMLSFYADDTKPFGVNNLVLQGASMPHVLWELQGLQKPVYSEVEGAGGETHEVFEKFEQVTEGSLSAAEYEEVVRDIVNFLSFIGEPVKLERRALGIKVIGFLILFWLLAYALKREYWKQVH